MRNLNDAVQAERTDRIKWLKFDIKGLIALASLERAMYRLFVYLLLAFSCAANAEWTYKEQADAMTDEKYRVAFVNSKDGSKFSLTRRSDNSVWGYLALGGMNQFMIGERLMVRVDANDPKKFNEDLQKLSKSLGRPILSWEWNPNLIGFRIWHGKIKEGCAPLLKELFNGDKMVIRYHPNQSTTRDVWFDISKNKSAIERALGVKSVECGRHP